MGRKVMRFIGGILIGVLIALVVGGLIVWQLRKHMRVVQEPPAPPAVSIAEPEKKVAPPPVEKQPVAEKRAAKKAVKKVAKKKPPALARKPVREERKWERWNAAPYATSQEEACKKAPEAIDGFAFPAPVKEQFKKLLGTTCKGGTNAWLTPGTLLEEMLSGPDAHHKQSYVMRQIPVAELPVLKSPDGRPYRKGAVAETAKALAWRVEHEGRAYMLYLPLVCWNWSWKFGIPPVPPPPPPVLRPAPISVPPPISQARCYTIPFDYRNTSGVVWDDRHRAHVSAHLDVTTERELEEVFNDPCFGVIDAKGFRKPFHRCELCDQGEYPPAGLADAVGLPVEEPKGVLSFYLQDGVGSLSLPLQPWAARWMLFCIDVIAYGVAAPGYEGWQAVSRMDVVEGSEIERTLFKGKLDRTLSGARLY